MAEMNMGDTSNGIAAHQWWWYNNSVLISNQEEEEEETTSTLESQFPLSTHICGGSDLHSMGRTCDFANSHVDVRIVYGMAMKCFYPASLFQTPSPSLSLLLPLFLCPSLSAFISLPLSVPLHSPLTLALPLSLNFDKTTAAYLILYFANFFFYLFLDWKWGYWCSMWRLRAPQNIRPKNRWARHFQPRMKWHGIDCDDELMLNNRYFLWIAAK